MPKKPKTPKSRKPEKPLTLKTPFDKAMKGILRVKPPEEER